MNTQIQTIEVNKETANRVPRQFSAGIKRADKKARFDSAINAYLNSETISSIVKRLGITTVTFHNWKKKAGLVDIGAHRKVTLQYTENFAPEVSCKVDGDKLHIAVMSLDRRAPGLHKMTFNFVSEDGASIPTADFEMMIADAANQLMSTVVSPEHEFGEMMVAFVSLPESYVEKYGIKPDTKAYLSRTTGGRVDYAHLTFRTSDGLLQTAFKVLKDNDVNVNLRVLAATMVANSITGYQTAA